MKTFLIILGICTTAVSAYSQRLRFETIPVQAISKEVVKLQLRNAVYVPSKMRGGLPLSPAKGVSKISTKSSTKETSGYRITTKGTPDIVMSKGVSRFQSRKEE